MACTFWVLTVVLGSFFLFASGQNNLCSNSNDENCIIKLKTLNIFNPRQRPLYRPIYRLNEILDLSNQALTRLLPQTTTTKTLTVSTDSSSIFDYTTHRHPTPDISDEVPYIDLYGITDLLLSNNSVSVEVLATILHYQRHGRTHPLKYLDLSYSNISWLPYYIFELLPNLEVLKLNNNPIGDMYRVKFAIKYLKNLKALDISGCSLESLRSDFFDDIHLTKLNLNSNLFTTVPRLTSLSSSLLQLSIDNNPISVLDDSSFRTLYVIDNISAENCSIHTITGETFSTNFRLMKLNLKNNQIRHLLPNDINVEHTTVSLENNLWDCTCRNLWLMRETHRRDTKLDRPHKLRCSTPTLYASRTLYEAALTVETSSNCDLLFLDLFQMHTPPESDYFVSLTKTTKTNIFIVAGLLAIISIIATLVLIKKFNHNSRLEIYKPLHKILQQKDAGLLNEKNIQHI